VETPNGSYGVSRQQEHRFVVGLLEQFVALRA
jgi:hypothetical protein